MAADRSVHRVHAGKADVDLLRAVIGFDSVPDVPEQGSGLGVRGIVAAPLEVDVNARAPRVFLHDSHEFRQERVLRAVRVFLECGEHAGCSVMIG